MELTPITEMCAGGACPHVWVSDRDTVVVQGYVLPDGDSATGTTEGRVEIPLEVFLAAAGRLLSAGRAGTA